MPEIFNISQVSPSDYYCTRRKMKNIRLVANTIKKEIFKKK